MKAVIILAAFAAISCFAAFSVAPTIQQFKDQHDAQTYQMENMLEGIDVKPEGERDY